MNEKWLATLRLLMLIAISASAVLFVHYLDPADSDFCSAHSGCEAVRHSALSYLPLGPGGTRVIWLNLPLLGMLAFIALLVISLVEARAHASGEEANEEAFSWTVSAALVGGAVGLGLLVYQPISAGAFCWLCVIVDVTAVAIAFSAWRLRRSIRAGVKPSSPIKEWGWGALGSSLVVGIVGWHFARPAPPVPSPVRNLYQADKINVVEFADFQCPFCRRLHPTLEKLVREYAGRVNFVRLHLPLEGHPMARPAARAAICAEKAGKGEEAARLLFEQPLTSELISSLPDELALNRSEFERCLEDPKTDARIARDEGWLRSAGFKGLPTTYVGSDRIIGAAPEPVLRDAFERAARGEGKTGVPGSFYLGILIALVGAVAWSSRTPKRGGQRAS